MTPNATTSKPSTESDTDIRKNKPPGDSDGDLPYFDDLLDLYWGGPERRITGLTLRIIGVNAFALLMLAFGIFYLGQYQNSLIANKLDKFRTDVELIAAILSETSEEQDFVRQRVTKRLSQQIGQRIYVFGSSGELLIDSQALPDLEGVGDRYKEEEPSQKLHTVQILKEMAGFVVGFLPNRNRLPLYTAKNLVRASEHPDAEDAIRGIVSMSAWQDEDGHIFLTAASPMFRDKKILGAVLLARSGQDIEEDVGGVWTNILKTFLMTLLITVLLSIYLSGTIAKPLRKLAAAAEGLRKGRDTEIPDLSYRNDEIGELSIVLREMMEALRDRMGAIERFAADVAHELKNPLTSLKSAVETVSVVKKEKDRAKLMEIIADDIVRMDRLITDISAASRLDAELSREILSKIDLFAVLRSLLDLHTPPAGRSAAHDSAVRIVKVDLPHVRIVLNDLGEEPSFIWGLPTRVGQVFENLLSNALSFSPPGAAVHITIIPGKKTVSVTVEDSGPGIPENRLEKVFERFYTERPEHEDYGKHSGLGLSICHQIVSALGGKIFAENIRNESDEVIGARFTVILSRAT
ncbi:MAG: stimulus-sensing domain-containing protein [Alphaproteobacteria bacterium]